MTTNSDPEDNEVAVTLRIRPDIIDKVYEESRQRYENLGDVVNRVLNNYFMWQKPSSIGGNIPFSKGLIARVFDNLTDEQMDKIAQDYVEKEFKDQMLMLGRQYTLLSFMDLVCSWCEAAGFHYVRDGAYNVDKFVIRFDMGPKWAIFFGKFVQTIGEQFKDKRLEAEVMNNTIVFKITDSLV